LDNYLLSLHYALPIYNKFYLTTNNFYLSHVTPDLRDYVYLHGLHNSQLLTIAPTGTLSTMLGISGGIEPIYANSYTRKTESLHGDRKSTRLNSSHVSI